MNNFYRACLRSANRLPDLYLRLFYRLQFSDNFHALRRTSNHSGLYDRKLKRIKRELRKLDSALSGDTKAFAHVLDVAYGRRGKLRRELLEPLLQNPSKALPPPIIPAVPQSRPPTYSPELAALLTSAVSRTARPLRLKNLDSPQTLPTRADPASEEARLLGPFSKRREFNIRWRFFKDETAKLLLPLQMNVAGAGSSKEDALRAGIRYFGFQGTDLYERATMLTDGLTQPRNVRSRERRWLRRRYRQLLGRMPMLMYHRGHYQVNSPPQALSSSLPYSPSQVVELDEVNKAWANASGLGS